MLRKLVSRSRSRDVSNDTSSTSSLSLPKKPSRTMSTDPSLTLLHGTVKLRIIAARNVEGKSSNFFSHIGRSLTSSIDGVDPYCSVKIGYNKVIQTPIVKNSNCPEWNTEATLQMCHYVPTIDFRVKAAKRPGPLGIMSKVTHLSMLSISTATLAREKVLSGWYPLAAYSAGVYSEFAERDEDDEDEHDNDDDEEAAASSAEAPDDTEKEASEGQYGDINIELEYIPVSDCPYANDLSVPNTYFPLRSGIKVSFFQDADSMPGFLPEIPFHPEFEHRRCWVEMADAIMNSNGFIYVAGWAVWPDLVMVRTDGDRHRGLTLGEMLKQKAEEGVTVCVMVWDELASNSFFNGVMGTHDEYTIKYFRRSKVHAIKVGRQNDKDGPLSDMNDAVLFTHHQKTVIVSRDDEESGKQRVEAFIGGLDLTTGRYDNQDHSLFHTLNDGPHAAPDFWQGCATVSSQCGPREPWHDIHSKVTGVAAWDIKANFEGRWMRQASRSMRGKLHEHDDEETFMQAREEDELGDGDFNVQVLRSINATSTTFKSTGKGLLVRKSAATDQSIHNAYVHYIRSAKHFIYIENQYFIGSSHLWDSGQRGGFAPNLIPVEIAEKLCAKIRRNERFMVYLNIPMFPEGPPDSGAVQEILSHQRKTIGLITSRVARAIQESGSDTQISDWFNVFCLVNREDASSGHEKPPSSAVEKTLASSRRFMIYIHSKFAVFDDAVAIIGSANINSRSMDGSRDTEICIAAWQPDFIASGATGYESEAPGEDEFEPSIPKGDIAAFRASVWSEHFGEYYEEFENPSSLECVAKVNEMAELNWQHFASDDEEACGDMPHGHLAQYPYEIDAETGAVSTRLTSFPDFSTALVKGRATPGIPNILTT